MEVLLLIAAWTVAVFIGLFLERKRGEPKEHFGPDHPPADADAAASVAPRFFKAELTDFKGELTGFNFVFQADNLEQARQIVHETILNMSADGQLPLRVREVRHD
ncbi:MAG: hypothetical protein ACK4HD_09245 [Pannonibacter phragmitetus]